MTLIKSCNIFIILIIFTFITTQITFAKDKYMVPVPINSEQLDSNYDPILLIKIFKSLNVNIKKLRDNPAWLDNIDENNWQTTSEGFLLPKYKNFNLILAWLGFGESSSLYLISVNNGAVRDKIEVEAVYGEAEDIESNSTNINFEISKRYEITVRKKVIEEKKTLPIDVKKFKINSDGDFIEIGGN